MTGTLTYGISYGLGLGFFVGIAYGLLRGLGTGLRYEEQKNQEKSDKAPLVDRLLDGLTFGLCGAFSFMVVEDILQVNPHSTLIYSILIALFFFFAYGFGGGADLLPTLAQTIRPDETVSWSWVHMTQDMVENSKKSLIVALVTALSVSIVIVCVSSLFFLNVSYGVHYGLVFGIISGLIIGIAAILTNMLKSAWSSDILPEKKYVKPNEGIARSGRNALIGVCFFAPIGGIASGIACGIGFGWPTSNVAGNGYGVHCYAYYHVFSCLCNSSWRICLD